MDSEDPTRKYDETIKKESMHINQSLSYLEQVCMRLQPITYKQSAHRWDDLLIYFSYSVLSRSWDEMVPMYLTVNAS